MIPDITLDKNGFFEVSTPDKLWTQDKKYKGQIIRENDSLYFENAPQKDVVPYKTGVCSGYKAKFSGYEDGSEFELIVAVDRTTGAVKAQFVAIQLEDVVSVQWPAPFINDEKGDYSVLTHMQGLLLPSDLAEEIKALPFNGQMCSSAAYMPWFGQVSKAGSYIAHVVEAWDTCLNPVHPVGGPTRLKLNLLPSLGEMKGDRSIHYTFLSKGTDYVSLCKVYRTIAREEGLLISLKQKGEFSKNLETLIGCSVLHRPTKKHVVPDSYYYDKEHPENNDSLTTFNENKAFVEKLIALGAPKMYLHLDGWGQPGYDNKHPDYLPACAEAGGWDGLKSLMDTCHRHGHLFGLHDQYRDYYFDAPTYDEEQANHLANGKIYEMSRWAGGRQTYLCTKLALDYLKRNYSEILKNGISMDCVYLDVFTCNEPDECSHPHHRITRRQSLDERLKCFRYMLKLGILPSSEEGVDWAMPALVFCHWAPYASFGIPVPLLNLVYHDCFLIPWMLGKGSWGTPENELGFLHALLNAGMGYVGDDLEGDALQDNFAKLRILSSLQKRLAHEEMTAHRFVSDDRRIQETEFSDGTIVRVNFADESYSITPPLN